MSSIAAYRRAVRVQDSRSMRIVNPETSVTRQLLSSTGAAGPEVVSASSGS
jgi:hypothetical protein